MVAISASHISPLAALIAGILILIMLRILNYVVAIYLVLIDRSRGGGQSLECNSYMVPWFRTDLDPTHPTSLTPRQI